jgi:hypothetical protein
VITTSKKSKELVNDYKKNDGDKTSNSIKHKLLSMDIWRVLQREWQKNRFGCQVDISPFYFATAISTGRSFLF